uniref:Protein EXECUTER 1, chloroplastic n=1 Tax=Triticum urartu TaxID=4572 RepID=A0A8R7JZQ6_TRIUA
MASVYTAPRAPLPATAASFPSSSSSSRQLDPNPSRFLAAHRGQRLLRVRRLAGAAPTRRASDVASVFRCGARSPGADPGGEPRRGWDALFHDALQGAVRRWSEYVRNYWPSAHPSKEAGLAKGAESSHELEERGQGVEEDGEEVDVVQEAGKWSWERWKQHFALIQESERLVDELQLQLRTAVCREDYRSAHKLKLAIAATSRNDTVGRAISELHRAIEEERYVDAAYIRDHAGAGLLGWWSGISGSLSDPYGLIIRISAEHGRYVAKSYDIRQLASDGHGYPIFEIYFAEANGGYNLQAVHLKPDVSDSDQLQNMLSGKLDVNNINISSSSLGAKHEEHDEGISMDDQNSDDSDVAAGPAGLKNLSNDSTPIPRIKILKVAPMENINQDYIIKIFDQISEEDDDNDEAEIENESSQDIGDEDNNEEAGTISAEENNDESAAEKAQQIPRKRVGFRTTEQDGDLKFDRLKLSGGNRKLPVLQLGIKQLNNKVQPKLYGVTHFSRIQMPISSDPLSGYIPNHFFNLAFHDIIICCLSFMVLAEKVLLGRSIRDCIWV